MAAELSDLGPVTIPVTIPEPFANASISDKYYQTVLTAAQKVAAVRWKPPHSCSTKAMGIYFSKYS